MTAALRSVQQGLPVTTGRQTFQQLLDYWLNDIIKPNRRPLSYASYESVVRLHIAPSLGRYPLEDITPQRIIHLLTAKRAAGLAPSTVACIRAVIRTVLNRALKLGLVARNAAMLVDPPEQQFREPPHLSAAQARILTEQLRGDRLEPLIVLTLATGLRRGEVLGLRRSDINLDAGSLKVEGQY
jgi:integrase